MQLSNDLLEELSLTLFDIGAVQLGKFRLHSGRTSRVYLDLRLLVSFPQALRLATTAYQQILEHLTFDLLAAPPLAGLPIGTSLCLAMDKPLIYPRKTAKSYGTGRSVEGHWQVGETAVIIDDIITTGDSVLQAIVSLKAAGLQLSEAVVLIDTEQGGVAAMQNMGYSAYAAITMTRLLAILESRDRISAKERAKALKFLSNT